MKRRVCEIRHNSFVRFFFFSEAAYFMAYFPREWAIRSYTFIIYDSPRFCGNGVEISFIWVFSISIETPTSIAPSNRALDTHPSGRANVGASVCKVIGFKVSHSRCCIINVYTLGGFVCCVFKYNTHLASQPTTAHQSIWASLQHILQWDNPPLPCPLPPSASQLSLSPHLQSPPNLCDIASSAGVAASWGGRGGCQAPMSLSTNAQSAEEAQESWLALPCPR